MRCVLFHNHVNLDCIGLVSTTFDTVAFVSFANATIFTVRIWKTTGKAKRTPFAIWTLIAMDGFWTPTMALSHRVSQRLFNLVLKNV